MMFLTPKVYHIKTLNLFMLIEMFFFFVTFFVTLAWVEAEVQVSST